MVIMMILNHITNQISDTLSTQDSINSDSYTAQVLHSILAPQNTHTHTHPHPLPTEDSYYNLIEALY